MKFFRFDRAVGEDVSEYSTKNVLLAKIAKLDGPVQIGVMHMGPRGALAYHQAAVPQLFLVVQGGGSVAGDSTRRRAISAGQAVFLSAGESYELGTDYGMVAVVVEAKDLDPSKLMKVLG